MKLFEKLKGKKIRIPIPISFTPKTSLSLYLTPYFVRILELDKDGHPTFEPVEVNWYGKSEEEKINILKEKVKELNLEGKKAHTCITARNGILKLNKYPTLLSKKDLEEAIQTYVNTEKENLKEESVYDYYIWETEDKKYKVLALVIVRKSVYENLKNMVEKAGLELGIVDYEVITIINGGLLFNLRIPFAILYIDIHESVFVYYTGQSVTYTLLNFSLNEYLESKDETLLEDLFVEVKNQLLMNEVNTLYLAGKAIEHDDILERVLTNLPVLGPIEPEHVSASFYIPYVLSIRGLEGA
ncbi:hypothetical protein JCM9492_11900 [Aquifex pyrophilus]